MSGTNDEDMVKENDTQDEVDVNNNNEENIGECGEDSDDESASNWPDEVTAKLIELWKARRFMYDQKHKHYRNRVKKAKAIDEMSKELNVTRTYFSPRKTKCGF